MRRMLIVVGVLLFAVVPGRAQTVEDFNPPHSNCCLAGTAKSLSDQLQDWNQLGRYHAADLALEQAPADPKRVVFMGDSITDNWNLDQQFPGKNYVNRGIGGQTTPQMLVRMYPDVLDLKPAVVVILAGTNDIAQNTGPETITMIEENLMAMTELAQKHGIKVILCSVTPISDYTVIPPARGGASPAAGAAAGAAAAEPQHRIQTIGRPPATIIALNAWMKTYATNVGATYCDYFSAVVDAAGFFKDGDSNDGLHPNQQGYALMAPVVQSDIDQLLK
jgi:lysophospholipase L1-like esterase